MNNINTKVKFEDIYQAIKSDNVNFIRTKFNQINHFFTLDESLNMIFSYNALNILKYIEQEGIKRHLINYVYIETAAYYAYFDMIKHLSEQGVDIRQNDDFVMRWAARSGKEHSCDIVMYAVSKGANIYANEHEALIFSVKNDDLKLTQYLYNLYDNKFIAKKIIKKYDSSKNHIKLWFEKYRKTELLYNALDIKIPSKKESTITIVKKNKV